MSEFLLLYRLCCLVVLIFLHGDIPLYICELIEKNSFNGELEEPEFEVRLPILNLE